MPTHIDSDKAAARTVADLQQQRTIGAARRIDSSRQLSRGADLASASLHNHIARTNALLRRIARRLDRGDDEAVIVGGKRQAGAIFRG